MLFAEKLDGLHEEAQTQQGEKELVGVDSLEFTGDSAYACKLRGVYV